MDILISNDKDNNIEKVNTNEEKSFKENDESEIDDGSSYSFIYKKEI